MLIKNHPLLPETKNIFDVQSHMKTSNKYIHPYDSQSLM